MKTVRISDSGVRVVGCAWLEERATGRVPHRLPRETRFLHDLMTDAASSAPSGVRVVFQSDTRCIELEMLPTVPHFVLTESEAPVPAVDLEVDGALFATQRQKGGRVVRIRSTDVRNPDIELVDGPPVCFRFENLPAGSKQIELWLPPYGQVELRELRVDEGAAIGPREDRRPRWIHYGSSISQCSGASSPARTWPALVARRAGLHLHSLGLAGSCHMDPFVARYLSRLDARVITVKLGINVVNLASMRERAFVPAVHGFLEQLRDAHPRVPLLVVSPIFCPSAEECPGPSVVSSAGRFVSAGDPGDTAQGALTLRRIRELLSAEVDRRRQSGDDAIGYLDGLELFGAADAAGLPDDLHPDGPAYERLGERFYERVFAPGGLLPSASLTGVGLH